MKKKLLTTLWFIFVIILHSSAQTWTQKANLSGITRATSIAFSIDSVAYVGLGYNFSQAPIQQTDLWKYSPATDTWTQMSSLPGSGLSAASAFSVGSKGYVAGGMNSAATRVNDLWEYDAVLNSWTQKTSCPGAGRNYAVAFSINGKGYFGTGEGASNTLTDFWEYNPVTDSWLQRADVPGLARSSAVGFSIGNKGYIGSGYTASAVNDFWQYDPQSNTWTQKANIGTQGISDACAFAVGGEGYICSGYWNSATSDQLIEYDTLTDTWTTMTNCTGPARSNACGFAVGSKGYITCGNDAGFNHLNDLWEYSPNIPTSITNQNHSDNILTVFPAVASQFVTIHIPVAANDAWLSVMNTSGQEMVKKKIFVSGETIEVSSLQSGVYFVTIKTAAKKLVGKFIKQ